MAQEDDKRGVGGKKVPTKPDAATGSELEDMLLLRAGMALLPIFFRNFTVVEKPRRQR